MIMALAMLFMGFSAWVGWRHNPLYSMRSTLRCVLSLGAVMAAFVLCLIAAIRYTEHRSQAAQIAALSSVAVLGTLAMVAVAIGVDVPRAAPLPAAAKRVNVFRKRTLVWLRRFGWAVLMFAVLELVLPDTARITVGVIGALFVFIGIVLGFGTYIMARRTDQWLSAVEADPWVHWTYAPAQWRQWVQIEMQRAQPDLTKVFHWRRDWKKLIPVAASMLVAPFFVDDVPWFVWLTTYAFIVGVLVLATVTSRRGMLNAPAALGRKLAAAEPEVYFGADGLFAGGDFTPWLTLGVYLQAAFIHEAQPRSLTLQFQTRTVSIPLPEGRNVAADLERLQTELTQKCTRASIALAARSP